MLDRARRAFVGAWGWLAQELDSGVYGERDGVVVAATGLPDPTLNPAFLRADPADPAAAIRWAAELRRAHGAVSTGIDLPDGRHPGAEAALDALGYVRLVTRPGMSVHVEDLRRRPAPDGLTIRRVRTEDDWAAYVGIQVDVFGIDAAVAAEFPPYRLVGADRMELLVGEADDVVTCAAAVFVTGSDAGLYAVATSAAHRGRGHGSAITAAGVDIAAASGARVVSLQASPDGFPVYLELGFVESGSWVVWVDPSAEPSSG